MSEKTTVSGSNSVVVRQFFEIATGRVSVHPPQNEFRTISVTVAEQDCAHCYTADAHFDVWDGVHDGLPFRLGRCRVCGHEEVL